MATSETTMILLTKTKRPRSSRGPTRRCPFISETSPTVRVPLPQEGPHPTGGLPSRRRGIDTTLWRKRGRVCVNVGSVGLVYLLGKGGCCMSTIKKKKKNQRRSPLKTVAVDNIGLARKPRSWSHKLKKCIFALAFHCTWFIANVWLIWHPMYLLLVGCSGST